MLAYPKTPILTFCSIFAMGAYAELLVICDEYLHRVLDSKVPHIVVR